MRNGTRVPATMKGVGGGKVFPAVCFAEASTGDTVEVGEIVTDTAEALEDDASPPDKSIVKAFLGSALMCQGLALCVDFADPANFSVTISMARRALRVARKVLGQATMPAAAQLCSRKLMDVTGGLKSKLLERAQECLDSAESDLDHSRFKSSIGGFKEAQRMFQKVEEGALARAAKKNSSVAAGRMEVANRKADGLVKRVQGAVNSTEITQLMIGYVEVEAMAVEAVQLYEQCGEQGKSLIASKLRPVCRKLIEASESATEGDRLVESGRESGAAYHYEQAIVAYAHAKMLLDKSSLTSLADEMEARLKRCNEAVLKIGTAEEGVDQGLDDMGDAMANYANEMDAKEDVEEEGARNADPTLNGNMTKLRDVGTNVFSVFVSASFSDTVVEREALLQHVWPAVRQAVNKFGMEFEFVDPQLMVRERSQLDFDYAFQDECHEEFERCRVESVGVDFLCLVGGDDNGTPFPHSIPFETYSELLKYVAKDKHKSEERKAVMEWFKLNTNSNPRTYVLIDKYKKMPQLSSNDAKKKEKAWSEWAKELKTLQKGFNFACTTQRFMRRTQDVQVGIYQALGSLDTYKRKAKVEELFKLIDEDGSGEIDRDELRQCFLSLGVDMPASEVQSFMNEYDSDGGGTIGFNELELMMEALLMDARQALGKHGTKHQNLMDVSHTHYFTETLLYQEVLRGILERDDGRHATRSLAVMWGYDSSRGPMPDEDPQDGDAMKDIRAEFQGKSKAIVDPRNRPVERPDFFKCLDVPAIKAKIARRLNPPATIQEIEEARLEAEEEEEDMDPDVQERDKDFAKVRPDEGEEGKIERQKQEVLFLLNERRSMTLKALGKRAIKQMSSMGRIVEQGGTQDSPFRIVRQHEEGEVPPSEEELKAAVREKQGKLDRIEQRLFTMKNAMDRRHAEESMRELEQEIRWICTVHINSTFTVHIHLICTVKVLY